MRLPIVLLLCISLLGCSSRLAQHQQAITAYQLGQFPKAEKNLSSNINQTMPEKDFTQNKDAVCLLLDRATTRFADGNVDGAIADYNLAIEAIDYYTQDSIPDSAAMILLEDSSSAYSGEDYEQLLARVYFALALIHKGDLNNAQALLRQAEEWQQEKTRGYCKSKLTNDLYIPDNPIAKYLFALLLEKRGDFSNANILYNQAEELNTSLNSPSVMNANHCSVVAICHNGNAPQKYSATSDASIVSMIALELILAGSGVPPACSSLVGIPIPAYWTPPYSNPMNVHVSLDGIQKKMVAGFDVASAAEWELKKKMPLISARGAARLLMRRATVGYFKKQDPLLGAFADVGMLVANANTLADTRSWGTLPSRIDVARFEVEASEHSFKIFMPGGNTFEANLKLNPGALCVINIFQIHPGITYVLIPDQFKIK